MCELTVLVAATKRDFGVEGGSEPSEEELMDWLLHSVESRCEGLMCKKMDAPYVPSTKRSDHWIKVTVCCVCAV